jgi:hypothetical protein
MILLLYILSFIRKKRHISYIWCYRVFIQFLVNPWIEQLNSEIIILLSATDSRLIDEVHKHLVIHSWCLVIEEYLVEISVSLLWNWLELLYVKDNFTIYFLHLIFIVSKELYQHIIKCFSDLIYCLLTVLTPIFFTFTLLTKTI